MSRREVDPGLLELVFDMGLDLGPDGAAELDAYARLLAKESQLVGLSALSGSALFRELVLDSLHLCKQIPQGARLVDVGSGGGVPGVPVALARPDVMVMLVESSGRKAEFLERVTARFGAGRITVCCQRAEVFGRATDGREAFDVATAKAVAPLRVLLELTLPLLRVGGLLLAPKGPRAALEVEQSGPALEALGGQVEQLVPYALGEKAYNLCCVRKLRPTPARFPRRPGIPRKRPL